jgi:hypothetical protein
LHEVLSDWDWTACATPRAPSWTPVTEESPCVVSQPVAGLTLMLPSEVAAEALRPGMVTWAAWKRFVELVVVVEEVAAMMFRQTVPFVAVQICDAVPIGPLFVWPGVLSTPRISEPKSERIVMWPWNCLVVVAWYSPVDRPTTISPPRLPPGSVGRTLAPRVTSATVPWPCGLPASWSGGT